MSAFRELGKKIYDMNNPREVRRMAVFVIRCWLNHGRMQRLFAFFNQNGLLRSVAEMYPFVYEQPTRAFFYNQSTFDERARLVEQHMEFLAVHLQPAVMCRIYAEENIPLWQMEYDGKILALSLYFEAGQRKEGLLSVMLRLDGRPLYQIIFWIAKDHPVGDWSMWIGAMQGPNMENAREIVKQITKQCHAYRTKNLILYMAQAVARSLGLRHIYAVTNYGYYANNHLRTNRKLKTSFSDFWQEAGGQATDDRRFDELPLVEPRKTMDEVPTRKRAVYRRRFALLDEIDTTVAQRMEQLLRMGESCS